MTKYLVTGSNGFIGSNLCTTILGSGDEVRSIPRDYLSNYYDLKSYAENYNPNVIIHLAAYGNHSTQNHLEKTVDANINKTVTLLTATQNINYDSFINISTSSVTLETETYYSATKAATERICKAFSRENNKPIVSVRPYSVYGPGEAKNRFIPKIVQAAKYDHDLQIVMSPKHDWIYVQDFINALFAIIPHSKELAGKYVGVGTGKEATNQEVFETLEEIHGSKIKHNTVDLMRDYDCDSWVCDTEIIEYLGWKQQYTLGEGLKKTYDCY